MWPRASAPPSTGSPPGGTASIMREQEQVDTPERARR
jgi:hypothetical protein